MAEEQNKSCSSPNFAEETYMNADPVELQDNAFRELAADEHYRPIMHPARDYAEVTPYSVITST